MYKINSFKRDESFDEDEDDDEDEEIEKDEGKEINGDVFFIGMDEEFLLEFVEFI